MNYFVFFNYLHRLKILLITFWIINLWWSIIHLSVQQTIWNHFKLTIFKNKLYIFLFWKPRIQFPYYLTDMTRCPEITLFDSCKRVKGTAHASLIIRNALCLFSALENMSGHLLYFLKSLTTHLLLLRLFLDKVCTRVFL